MYNERIVPMFCCIIVRHRKNQRESSLLWGVLYLDSCAEYAIIYARDANLLKNRIIP